MIRWTFHFARKHLRVRWRLAHHPRCAATKLTRIPAPQVATIDALLCGVYDGHLSLAQVGRHGDFGIGTFETNVPGYHMHFLADDLGGGGHVLAFTLAEGTLELDTVHDLLVRITGFTGIFRC